MSREAPSITPLTESCVCLLLFKQNNSLDQSLFSWCSVKVFPHWLYTIISKQPITRLETILFICLPKKIFFIIFAAYVSYIFSVSVSLLLLIPVIIPTILILTNVTHNINFHNITATIMVNMLGIIFYSLF